MRKRSVWVEPLFGEAKQWHGLRQFRLRGLMKVNTESLLTAAGQNLKRWLVATAWGRRRPPRARGPAPARGRAPPPPPPPPPGRPPAAPPAGPAAAARPRGLLAAAHP